MTARFSSTLRSRPVWISAVDVLYKAPPGTKWMESKMEAQDLVVSSTTTGSTDSEACFRFLLLSPAELDNPATQIRLERFCNLTAHTAIVFLDEAESTAFVDFQIRMMQSKLDVPVVPIKSTAALPGTVTAFHERFSAAQPRISKPQAVRALLPFCTVNPPIREHNFNMLSDIVPSFKVMIEVISTRQGQDELCSYIGQSDASDVIKFWTAEYTA
ncbi:hypothetical protein MCOR27_002814 [Pyricularia oryzae]|uniref:Uncharacterized protein n=2 Tax=Pyricularia TaxID=48558 RepID=A0ABQ8NC43_PYRGI|nr:hypothetical protein MCOR01_005770 [Pyricularia oryzae]KAI6294669.1 hypothetical protein MCOR33_008236 [Pyricularia grisea]KAH9434985.1 hypothetical protein MCOR02_003948 [Pyricularia oryzae]KAI6261749.1 hypothetical protein MCOR19_001963 [Pyricularia oryzae]KAI6281186.1 hypothetical protein MCOR26_003377 [Pyricularia oryzae]